MTRTWHLAQINIGRLIAPEGDARVQGFFDALESVNALADVSPGFVWRLQDDEGAGATGIKATIDPQLIVNMSVWTDAESLFDFVYRSAHTPVMAQRRGWFERPAGVFQALWWIEAGTIPTVSDGIAKLWHLDRFGPTPQAFTFKTRFPPPGELGHPIDMHPDPWCEGRA